jgi:hypothetical protein
LLKQDDVVKTQLVLTGWRFGQLYSAGFIGAQMVMSTIANRVRAGWGSYLVVIERIPLHMAENELPPLKYPSLWEPDFVKLLHAVEGVFEGSAHDMSAGALYWGELNKIERGWFKEHIIDQVNEETGLRRHPLIASMNSLSFFK